MVRLKPGACTSLRARYEGQTAFFPLIASVIAGVQDGIVLASDAEEPRQAYVEHAFGFAQVFGEPDPAFERDLEDYLVAAKDFNAPKVRLYAPAGPHFLHDPAWTRFRAERQRFRLPATASDANGAAASVPGARAVPVDIDMTAEIDRRFSLTARFWRTAADFVAFAGAVAVVAQDEIVALCYAAAVAQGKAEIDVITREDCRGRGFGRLAALSFMNRCKAAGIEPLWDCFTNNEPSMATARSLGFRPQGPAYALFTIPRK